MSRRHLTYAALVVASIVVSACSVPTEPTREDTACRNPIIHGSGNKCEG
jgi:hypothetical protein